VGDLLGSRGVINTLDLDQAGARAGDMARALVAQVTSPISNPSAKRGPRFDMFLFCIAKCNAQVDFDRDRSTGLGHDGFSIGVVGCPIFAKQRKQNSSMSVFVIHRSGITHLTYTV
jgi:hypothetical protein